LLGLRPLACAADWQADPQEAMAQLAAAPQGWFLPLGLDPGAELAQPGCWSEALGAWRQPVLLQLPAAEAESGLARAYTALLAAAGVPLAGSLEEEAAEALRLHLLARWQLSSARAAEPAHPTP
jgi:hypothetical protein